MGKVRGLQARPLPQGPERARHPEEGRFIHNETGAAVQGCEGTAPSARVGGRGYTASQITILKKRRVGSSYYHTALPIS